MNVGDTVKIMAPNTAWTGYEAEVLEIDPDDRLPVVIQIVRDQYGNPTKFSRRVKTPRYFAEELQLVSPLVILARESE
jgi:hypothetical protein